MATQVTQLRRVENVEPLPDGVYDGIWGGYCVIFDVDGVTYEGQTQDGIRTPRCKCKVTIANGKLSVDVVRQ